METRAQRTVTVTLEVVSESDKGWKVRAVGDHDRGVFVAEENAVRLSPGHASPARFRMPAWQWAKLASLLNLP